jgi:alpha-beta hydrolase superfamily lysophospholipase
MDLIKNIKVYPSKKQEDKYILLMCGFGGSIWQTRRLIRKLNNAGYYVTALDFPEKVLSSGEPYLLPELVKQVVTFAEREAKRINKKILLVGISLGALISLNILRRSAMFEEAVMITGGDIVKVSQNLYGSKIWPQSYKELAKQWKSVNMYTEPKYLKGKRMLFVLPSKDKLIDPDDVRNEVHIQNEAGNKLILLERHKLGHKGTIIEETILFPGRVLQYINQVASL